MTSTQAYPTIPTPLLRGSLEGRVIAPGDRHYDEARTVFPGGIDRRPAAIVRPAGALDVARAVSLARDSGLELAVRSGGHSSAGHGVSDGGLVIDLRDMRDLAIDPQRRIASAQTGLTAGEYTAAGATHRLATPFGDTGSVGIGGITLGGGVGFLARLHGLTVDSLLAAELVTADGEIVHVGANSQPDLFWAIRGGGGNFGVATLLEFRLHPVDEIVGGMLFLPATAEVIAGVVAAAEAAPDALTTIVNIVPAPPAPFLPEDVHGRLVTIVMMAYAGGAETGMRVIAPFRELAAPLADMVRPMRYPDVFMPEPEGHHPVSVIRTLYADGIDIAKAEAILAHLRSTTATMAAAQLRPLGGAVARVPDDATAYAHRSRRVMANVVAMYDDPDDADAHAAWADRFAAALSGGEPGAYVNFLGDEGGERIQEAYPDATYERLAAIKARWDPDNVFRLNQNIAPAAVDAVPAG
jgi:FAD/FMN-containing dehydrogenase